MTVQAGRKHARVYMENGDVVGVEVWADGRWQWADSFEVTPTQEERDSWWDDPANFVDFDGQYKDERLGL